MPKPRAIYGIRIHETVARRRLVREDSGSAFFEALFILITAAYPLFFLYRLLPIDVSKPNNWVVAFGVSPLLVPLCLYVIYRLFTEGQFQKTSSPLDAKNNKQAIISLLRQYGIPTYRQGPDYVIADSLDRYPGAVPCVLTFIVADQLILSNVLNKSGFRGARHPSLIGLWLLRRDIRRALKRYSPPGE